MEIHSSSKSLAKSSHDGSSRRNQRERILQLLISAHGAWVPSTELATISLQYNARVFELREHFEIANKVEHQEDGRSFGYFRLVGTRSAKPVQGELFAELSSHRDLG